MQDYQKWYIDFSMTLTLKVLARLNPHDNKYRKNLIPCFSLSQITRYFKQDYPISKISITYLNMQMREEIWKWDVLDSSKYYPLLNSEDFISNFPAIWQKLLNIENIINLINYANEWRNLKTKCMLHNHSLCSTGLRRNHLNPSSCFGGVGRKRN
jgi:hypothetical protein